ncbi:MAG TPA: endolytic transglycosylase MltG [Thermoanaerobaculia bacterium]|nr:endolytic transglycosylase MltG [Thermoanaerobaculia bacterium]
MARGRGCFSVAMRSVAILVFFGVVFAAGLGFFLHRALNTPYRGYQEAPVLVEVERGSNSGEILEKLRSKGVLRDDFVPLVYLKTLRRGASLKAGVYEFKEEMTPIAVIDKLARGDVIFRTVVLREGLDRFAVGAIMAEAGFGTTEEWNEVTGSGELVRDFDPVADSLEGYLFPDTYKLTPGTATSRIAEILVQNFRSKFGEQLAFISTGLSPRETVTLASIIETEARLQEERPVIASVYMNRLRRNMILQADPTVIYALKLEGKWDGNITHENLRHDSPYNTYRHSGLPPGPIASPGLASLNAAVSPARSEFLYFVSRNDGSHVFSRTLAEHNRNVQEYQRDYFRRLREKQAAEGAESPPADAPGK